METNWRNSAACIGVDTELFYKPSTRPAIQEMCAGCPVRDQCVGEAIEKREGHGYWGGSWRSRKRAGMLDAPTEFDWVVELREQPKLTAARVVRRARRTALRLDEAG